MCRRLLDLLNGHSKTQNRSPGRPRDECGKRRGRCEAASHLGDTVLLAVEAPQARGGGGLERNTCECGTAVQRNVKRCVGDDSKSANTSLGFSAVFGCSNPRQWG
eukprot:3859601-Pyramimonas_sp.AAC.1